MLDPAAGGEGLALDDAELMVAVVISGPGDVLDLPGADAKHSGGLHDVGP